MGWFGRLVTEAILEDMKQKKEVGPQEHLWAPSWVLPSIFHAAFWVRVKILKEVEQGQWVLVAVDAAPYQHHQTWVPRFLLSTKPHRVFDEDES